jgi:RHS repeat-associated protein
MVVRKKILSIIVLFCTLLLVSALIVSCGGGGFLSFPGSSQNPVSVSGSKGIDTARSSPPAGTSYYTGIKPFWTYDANTIGGGGKAMVNLWSGNLAVQYTDVSFPGRGLPVELRRTYNSQANYESSFGTGWTSIFDAHLEFEGTDVILRDGYGGRFVFTNPQSRNGNLIYTSPPGRNTVFLKRSDGRYVERKKNNTRYIFNADGKLNKLRHRNNNNYLIMVYDSTTGKLERIKEASGRITKIHYNGAYISKIIDPEERETTYHYNGTFLQRVVDPEGNETKFRYQNGLLRKIINPRQYESIITYDAVTKAVKKFADPLFTVTYTYYDDHTTVNDTYGHSLSYYLDQNGCNTQITDTMGFNTYFQWNSNLDIMQVRNAKDQITDYTYNSMGDVLSATNSLFTVSYSYDIYHNLISTVDGNNQTTSFAYTTTPTDPYGVLSRVTTPMGRKVEFAYDEYAQPLTVTNARNFQTHYAYSQDGYVTAVTDAKGSTTTITYNNVGEALENNVPINGITHFSYNKNGVVTSVQTPSGATTSYSYDQNSNRTAFNDPLNHTTRYTFNEDDAMSSVTDALNHITTYTYTNGNLASTQDPAGFITTMAYDANDRMTSRSNPITTETFTYDPLSNILTKATSLGTITTTYDAINRPIKIEMPNRTVNIALDHNGNRLSDDVVNTDGAWHAKNFSVSYSYDNDNRLISKAKTLGNSICEDITYEYDSNSNLTSLSMRVRKGLPPAPPPDIPEETLLSFTYQLDELDRQTSVQNAAGETFSAVYDSLGNMTEINYPDGSVSARVFDNENRITTVTNDHPISDPPHIVYDYTYDSAGNFTTVKSTPPDVAPNAYTYDALNRLAGDEASHMQFVYDSAGNKVKDLYVYPGIQTEVNYTYNGAHQIIKRTPGIYTSPYVDYEYDQNGNNSRKYIPPEDPYSFYNDYRFTYNAANRLLSHKNVTGFVYPNDLRFSYDADNELFFSEQTTNYSPEYDFQIYTSTFYGYESGARLYENISDCSYSPARNEFTPSYDTLKYYTYLNGLKVGFTDVYLNQSYYCSYDGQGNIVQTSNRAGEMPYALYSYSSYGQQWQIESNGYPASGATYKGYDNGPFGNKTGVRHYDNETGRFTSPDPFKGCLGDPQSQHPYMYCRGNPVKYSDPSGYLQMTEEDQKAYPEFAKFIQELPDNVQNDNTAWYKLKTLGGYKNAVNLKTALQWGKGPLLMIVDPQLTDKVGSGPACFDTAIREGIFIDPSTVKNFCEGSDGILTGGALKLYAERLILHELVHYGCFKYLGISKSESMAEEFNKVYRQDGDISKTIMKNQIWPSYKNRRSNY